MATVDRTTLLIDFVRGMLLGNITAPPSNAAGTTYFQDNNYGPGQLYRRNTPQVKDPQYIYPCLIFSWDPDDRERTTDIDHGVLTVQVYTNEYTDTENAGNAIADALHLLTTQYTSSEGTLYLYMSHDMGGPAEPIFNNSTNTWSTACSFRMRIG